MNNTLLRGRRVLLFQREIKRTGGAGPLYVSQLLDEAAAALMLFGLKILPLGLDLVVQLQHGAGLGLLDAQLVAAFHGLAEDNGVDTLFLVVRVDGDEQQVHGVVPVEGLENVDPAGGHEAAPVLLQGGGQAWRTYAEGHHAVVFIHDEAGGVGIDEGRELGGVLFDLAVREIHSAVQRRVGQVDQLEKRLEQGR